MSDFMCKRDVGDFRRYVGGVVLHSDYTGVQRLLFSIRVQLAFLADSSRAPWEGKVKFRADVLPINNTLTSET